MDTDHTDNTSTMIAAERTLLALLVFIQAVLIMSMLMVHSEPEPVVAPLSAITVITVPVERVSGDMTPYGPGFEKELMDHFFRQSELKVNWIYAEDWKQGWELFLSRGHLYIPAGHAPNPKNVPDSVRAGPVYDQYEPALIRTTWSLGLSDPLDICSYYIHSTGNPSLASALEQQGRDLDCRTRTRTHSADLRGLLEILADNDVRFILAEGSRFQLLEPFYTGLRRVSYRFEPIPHRWYWKKNPPELDSMLQHFWADLPENRFLEDLKEKYFGFFPGKNDYYEINHLFSVLEQQVPKYKDYIIQAAQENRIDPLLLIALIYQESRFDPRARSGTGVRGLSQLTLPTASDLNIDNRLDPKESILGGARYLRQLRERFDEMRLTGWDRWFYALSAYNQGFGHTMDAIRLALQQGKSGVSWRELKTVYPLLSYSKYYKGTKYGYARGYEAVSYVEAIRYYYYILHGLIVLSRPEAEHLAPFLEVIPVDWP